CGGSVTTVALDMGIAFGCDPVVLIGQDLSFLGGRTHMEGSVYVEQDVIIDKEKGAVTVVTAEHMNEMEKPDEDRFRPKMETNLLWLKGLDGERVPSKYDWVTFHQWFEDYMRYLEKSDLTVKVINATEGGAFIEGMEHTTLADVIERYIKDEKPVERILEDAERAKPPVDYDGLLDSFREMLENTIEIGKLSRYILKESAKVKKRFKKTGLHADLLKNIDKIKGLEKELFDKAEKVIFLWEALMACTIKHKEYLKEEIVSDEQEQFGRDLDSMIKIYKEVVDIAKKFKPVLTTAIETVERYEKGEGQEAAL
ncbi:MAG: hypothetical protein V3V95_02755, partial [Thermodesulfobacteriota bacterium]